MRPLLFPRRLRIIVYLLFVFIQFNPLGTKAQESQEKIDFAYGERLFNEGFFDLALIQFESFVGDYPSSPKASDAVFKIGECHFLNTQFHEAQKSFLRLILKYPESTQIPYAHYKIAQCFEEQNKFDDAIPAYYRVYDRFAETETGLNALQKSAELSMIQQKYGQSESYLNRLIDAKGKPEFRSIGLFLLSKLYEKQGKLHQAVQVLIPLSEKPIREGDGEEANFLLGSIYTQMGRFSDATRFFQKVVDVRTPGAFHQKAYFHLGSLHQTLGEWESAQDAFLESIRLNTDDLMTAKSHYHLGFIEKSEHQFEKAIEQFQTASENEKMRFRSYYEIAHCHLSLQQYSSVKTYLERILNDSMHGQGLKKMSILLLASIQLQTGESTEGIALYSRYIKAYPECEMNPLIMLKIGKVQLEEHNHWDAGLTTLRRIWNVYPGHEIIPETRYEYANGLTTLERFKEAIQIYSSIAQQYPSSKYAFLSVDRIKSIQKNQVIDYGAAFTEYSDLVQDIVENPQNEILYYNLGKISQENLKQYRQAISYFAQYLERNPATGRRSDVLYRIAECGEQIYSVEGLKDYLESAISGYTSLLKDTLKPDIRQKALSKLAYLISASSNPQAFSEMQQLWNENTDMQNVDEIRYLYGRQAQMNDSLNIASQHFEFLATRSKSGPYHPEALLGWGMVALAQGDSSLADSLMQRFINDYPNELKTGELIYQRALLYAGNGEYSTAISVLENNTSNLKYSAWSDSVRLQLGDCYLHVGEFSKAINIYQSLLKSDSLNSLAHQLGLIPKYISKRSSILFAIAQANRGLGKHHEARKYFQEYLLQYYSSVKSTHVMNALASMAEKDGQLELAESYLSKLAESYPADTTIQMLGDYHFRLGKFTKAIQAYDRALSISNRTEIKEYLTAQVVLAFLKDDKIPQAEVRINIFDQTFENSQRLREYKAQFLYEKAMAYIRQKSFDPALETLKDIQRKYRNTKISPDVELQIGRVYLITNKIEDALRTLTQMPQKYEGHVVLGKVYLNLGVHYFNSRQFDNALRAFNLALDTDPESEIIPTTMRYLIRVYDSMRMWDAALRVTRSYIDKYPSAEDYIQKRVQVGTLYMKLNEYDRAVDIFRDIKPIADSETEAEIQYWIGQCYSSMGQFHQAVFEYLKVAYLSKPSKLPWQTTALYEAGQCYLKLDNREKARQLFENIVRREGSTSDLGRIARQRIDEIDQVEHTKE